LHWSSNSKLNDAWKIKLVFDSFCNSFSNFFATFFTVSFSFNLLIMSSSWNKTSRLQVSMNSLFSFINISSENLDNSEHDSAWSSSSNVVSVVLIELQSLHNEQYVLYNYEQEYQHIFLNWWKQTQYAMQVKRKVSDYHHLKWILQTWTDEIWNNFYQTALVESKRLKLICRLCLHVYEHSNNRSINNSIMKHHLNSKNCDRCTNLATKITKVQDIYNFVRIKASISCFLAADCKINCKTDCKRDYKRLINYSIAFFIKNILQKSLHYNFKRLSLLWTFFILLLTMFNFNEHLKWYNWALLCCTELNLWSLSRIERLLFKSTYSRIYQWILKSSLI